MKVLSFLLLILFSFLTQVQASEKSETFIVTLFENSIKVVSPVKKEKVVTVIIENKTLMDIRGVLKDEDGHSLEFMTINTTAPATKSVLGSSFKKLYFVSLAPAFQEAELIVGRSSYEIPYKK